VADGAKLALWQLYRNNFPMVNFVHDEVIFEFIEDASLQECCHKAEAIMLWAMRKVIPDVAIRSEGALMYVWDKAAESLKNENGDYLVWEPEVKKEKV
jgi:hypothetical protein